jgi:hypothetical protein
MGPVIVKTMQVLCSFLSANHFYHNSKQSTMGNLLYAIAVILIIGWLIGFVGYNTGGIIHILLVIAAIAVILRIIQGRRL